MKHLYTILATLLFTFSLSAQGYEFAIQHNGGYNFSVVATPDFDGNNTDISDIGFALMLPTGSADITNVSQFNGRTWSATQVTAAQLSGLGLGDGTRDAFAMNLPPGQTILSHSNGVPFTLVTFDVNNMPTSGLLEILSNSDPIATGLGGAVDSFYNANIDTTSTQNYFEGLTSGMEEFMFETLSIAEVDRPTLVIKMFPNPASDIINIEASFSIDRIELFDITGKLVLNTKEKDNIKINHLPNGVYILKIYAQQSSVTKKLVIN